MGLVGVIGLGNIGGAIAANLVADGHEVTVLDADPSRAQSIQGARVAASPAEVGAAGEITITSLPAPEVVAAVAHTWVTGAAPGSILLDISTTAPATSRDLAERLARNGHHAVDAPLTGGAVGARNRSLVFMVGGEAEVVERCRPLLERLGRAVFHMGGPGTGSTMKLANSLVAFACTWASLEALSLTSAASIPVRTAVEVVRTGGASNFFLDRAVEDLDNRGRPTQFALELAAKDAGLIEALAAEHRVPAPVAAAVAEVLRDAVDRGLGPSDWSDLVELAEERSGIPLRLDP
jgi:3-hydroxyisobutyrate dehydrogenase-like beta-hydroxyacid dehydrogenase